MQHLGVLAACNPSTDIYHTTPYYRRRNLWLRLALPCKPYHAMVATVDVTARTLYTPYQ